MKKKRSKQSTIVLASAIAALPMVGVPALAAQCPGVEKPVPDQVLTRRPPLVLKFSERLSKAREQYCIVGIDDGHPIYQNARGEVFFLNPVTGDMQFLARDVFVKFTENVQQSRSARPPKLWKWEARKFGGGVTILGIDGAGHVVQQNARGERFFLDPVTGDMVYVR